MNALYRGTIMHARRAPMGHGFRYNLYLLYVNVDALDTLPAAARPRRADCLGDPRVPLGDAVRDRVEASLGERPAGAIYLLTHVRTGGHAFNPVSFYYCHRRDGTLAAVVAEITNTPWGERHAYVLAAPPEGDVVASFDKAFHVSPFFPMGQRYRWRLSRPGAQLRVDMANDEGGAEVFRARLELTRQPLTARTLLVARLTQPLMTWKVHGAIYWQALRLWLRGAPFFAHPRTRGDRL